MKILLQIAAVFGICWVGEGLAKLLPLPGSVISMILLLILLLTGLLKPHHIRENPTFSCRTWRSSSFPPVLP